MADAKEKNEDRDSAVELLKEATELAETVPQMSVRATALSEIGRRLIALGQTQYAEQSFRHSLETVLNIRDKSTQAVALAALARVVSASDVKIELPSQLLQNLALAAGR
jgi:predicted TPR repeat methyltransferase